ncbi:MAG: hypothetical protein Q9160_003398 [Pyrenula sp. 1 TL-2023]
MESFVSFAPALAVSCFVGTVSVVIYRLYFHPLSPISGPRLAAVTGLYEFYYQCIKVGQYQFKIKALHEQYELGSIVRINPNEVHILDSQYFDKLHNVSSRIDKAAWYYRLINSPDAGFGTADANLHRLRRKAMSRFFASGAITKLESTVRQNVLKLSSRLDQLKKEGSPVNLSNCFRCLAADTVATYCMPDGSDFLNSVDFAKEYNSQARSISEMGLYQRYFPIIMPVLLATPRWLLRMTAPEGAIQVFEFQTVRSYAENDNLAIQAHRVANAKTRNDETVLQGIANSPDFPESEKTTGRLHQEARTLVGAGSETTGSSLDVIVFNVLSNHHIAHRLKEELNQASSEGIDLTLGSSLRSLPYLTAVVNEGLRLGNAVSGRLPRVDPRKTHIYKNYVLPAGTEMSMSLRFMATDPAVFEEPLIFNPD